MKPQNLCSNEDLPYVPVNEMKPEVLAMLAAWESRSLVSQKSRDESREADAPITSINRFCNERFELYHCTKTEPPKRFYRTFWQSISRRAWQKEMDRINSNMSINSE